MSTKHATWGMSFSLTFRDLARDAAGRALMDRENPQREQHAARSGPPKVFSSHTAETVILAVTALEAGINEMAAWMRHGFVEGATALPDDFMNMNIAEKWMLVPSSICGRTFERGSNPYQDFATLVALRDEVVHFKWHRDQVPRFMRSLQSRDLTLPEHPGIYWVEAALTDRVAIWALTTMDGMFAELASIINRKESLDWPWQ